MDEIESLHEALVEAVKASGGTKKVAAMLWPAKANQNLDAARRYLANCLNPECAEKLSLEEVMLILRASRKAGDHTAIRFLCATLNYAPPIPVEPEDRRALLQREFISRVDDLSKLATEIRDMGVVPSLRSVA